VANQYTKIREEETSGILSRLSAIETSYEGVASDVHSLAKSLEGFASETRTAIKDLADRISDSHRTPWSVLASWAGVVLTFASVVGGLIAYSIQQDINHTRDALHQEVQLRSAITAGVGWGKEEQIRYSERIETLFDRLDVRIRAMELDHAKGETK
jgi:hypothetical protein